MNREEEDKLTPDKEEVTEPTKEELDKIIQAELDKIIPIIKEKISNNDSIDKYSGMIRDLISENKYLLEYFRNLTRKPLEGVLAGIFENSTDLNTVAERIRRWYKNNKDKTNAKLKELDGLPLSGKEKELLLGGKPGRPKKDKGTPKKNNENEKNESTSDNTKENKGISGEETKEIATEKKKVVSLSEDVTETISKLNKELKEKDIELSDKDNEIENLINENLALKKALEAKATNSEGDSEYKIFLDVKSVLKLQEDAGKNLIPLELENSIITGVSKFVKKYDLLDVTNIEYGGVLPQSKLVKAALIAILKKNKFL